jgi:hypothetical protein
MSFRRWMTINDALFGQTYGASSQRSKVALSREKSGSPSQSSL